MNWARPCGIVILGEKSEIIYFSGGTWELHLC